MLMDDDAWEQAVPAIEPDCVAFVGMARSHRNSANEQRTE